MGRVGNSICRPRPRLAAAARTTRSSARSPPIATVTEKAAANKCAATICAGVSRQPTSLAQEVMKTRWSVAWEPMATSPAPARLSLLCTRRRARATGTTTDKTAVIRSTRPPASEWAATAPAPHDNAVNQARIRKPNTSSPDQSRSLTSSQSAQARRWSLGALWRGAVVPAQEVALEADIAAVVDGSADVKHHLVEEIDIVHAGDRVGQMLIGLEKMMQIGT